MRKHNQVFPFFIGTLIIVLLVGVGIKFYLNQQAAPATDTEQPQVAPQMSAQELLAMNVVSYLANPKFSSNNLLEQISGTKAKLARYIIDEGEANGGTLYFSLPDYLNRDQAIAKLSRQPQRVKVAVATPKGLEVGSLVSHKKDIHFFCFPCYDLKLDPSTMINVDFTTVKYSVTLSELSDFISEKPLVNGMVFNKFHERDNGDEFLGANFGSRVAKSGERSLTQLANDIVGLETDPSRKAQLLLDFVTKQIAYDTTEDDWSGQHQVMKRPNEVLMTKTATCGGLVTLYASLLEQVGINYWLVYYPSNKHIAVAVEGKFSNTNSYQCMIDGKTCSLAETTGRGFVIGKTRLLDSEFVKSPELYQQPTRSQLIYPKTTK